MKEIDVAETLQIGDEVNFVHKTDKGEKKVLQGKIEKVLENNRILIGVINDQRYNGTLCNRNIADII
jgi:hypothetical protein